MDRSPRLRLPWLAAFVAANTLVACGGGDDGPAPVGPPAPQPTTNLADCHNPSMYKVGSTWSVNYQTSGASAPQHRKWQVAEPSASWASELPEGTVLRPARPGAVGGADDFVRLRDGHVDKVWTRIPYYGLSTSPVFKFDPPLSLPIALASGEVYTSVEVDVLEGSYGTQVPEPVPPRFASARSGRMSQELTYVGRETITVPAGTFSTCHVKWVQRISGSFGQYLAPAEQEEWWIAEGPYRGVTVQFHQPAINLSSQAIAIDAQWK